MKTGEVCGLNKIVRQNSSDLIVLSTIVYTFVATTGKSLSLSITIICEKSCKYRDVLANNNQTHSAFFHVFLTFL